MLAFQETLIRAWQHHHAREPSQARALCRQVIDSDPKQSEAWVLLGVIDLQAGDAEAALAHFDRAAAVAPSVGSYHTNRGVVLQRLGRHAESATAFREALRLEPASAQAHYNLGTALRELERYAESEGCYRQVLQLQPAFAQAHNNLGANLRELGRFEEAEACYRRALELQPDLPEVHNNLGEVLRDLGRHDEAEAAYRRMLALQPDNAEGRCCLALLMLLRSDFERGWTEYGWRWRRPDRARPAYRQPAWDGSPLAGRIILLHAEQGIGDAIQFIRYARLVKAAGATVFCHCPPLLSDLLGSCPSVDQVISDGPLPPFDVHAPLLDLPQRFGTTFATIPNSVPYLAADPKLVSIWGERLAAMSGLKVGIVWQGSQLHKADRYRSVPLARFAPLARVPGVCLVSLQVGAGREQIGAAATSPPTPLYSRGEREKGRKGEGEGGHSSLPLSTECERGVTPGAPFPVIDLGAEFNPESLADAAAVLMNIDLLITVDTAMAHLAGALGVPVWVALPFADWRWLLDRDDSPWYPTMRLFRQQRRGDWNGVFARLAQALWRHASSMPVTGTLEACRHGAADGVDPHLRDLAQAWEHRNAGDNPRAEALCSAILRECPGYAEAWVLLGVIAFHAGEQALALEHFNRAAALVPANPAYHTNCGIALQALGRHAEAEAAFSETLRLGPATAQALYNRGTALRELERHEEAAACYRQALQVQPDFPEAHNNLGACLRQLDRYDEAEACYRRALAVRPTLPEVHKNLGVVLRDQQRFAEAEASLRRALELQPDLPEAHNELGSVLRELGRHEERIACFRRALELRPDYPEVHANLAHALHEAGKFDESAAHSERALALNPRHAEAHGNYGLLLLLRGDFQRGWVEYEWRWQLKGRHLPDYPQPLWDGGPLAGRTILLHAEQGLGDAIQCIRYARHLKERGATVFFRCPARLFAILRTCAGIDRLIPMKATAPSFDVQVPLMSLPRFFGTTVETVPAEVPYLAADPALVDRWRGRLASYAGLKVGIAWQGNPKYAGDGRRSVPLDYFEPLSHVPGVQLFSLQVGAGQEQIAALTGSGDPQAPAAGSGDPRRARFEVVDLGSQFDPSSFSDAAAVLKSLDLLITIDSALAHLAGALAVPVWLVLPFPPDWRWLLDREDSPWYPTMRLFRQSRAGEWHDVFARLSAALQVFKTTEPARSRIFKKAAGSHAAS